VAKGHFWVLTASVVLGHGSRDGAGSGEWWIGSSSRS
jgi:hypothetical protein